MTLQKTFLENNLWRCVSCGCSGTKGYDCAHKDYAGYIITIKGNNIGRIKLRGRIIASFPLYDLERKMKEQGLIQVAVNS